MNALPPIEFFYGQTPMQKFLSKLKPPFSPLDFLRPVQKLDLAIRKDIAYHFPTEEEQALALHMEAYLEMHRERVKALYEYYVPGTGSTLWSVDPITAEIIVTPVNFYL